MSRKTIAREKVLQLITNSEVAVSHNDIQNKLIGVCDRVTIYRILDRLVEEGLIHKIMTFDNTAKYAKCHTCSTTHSHAHAHLHFSCEACLEVTCLDKIEPKFNLPDNYLMKDANLTITGICPKCN
jgi:Fur family ferric uptake transcriptional regulator